MGEYGVKIPFLNPAGAAKFVDHQVTKANDIIKTWQGEEIEGFGIIGAPLSKSSISHSGAALAPTTIRRALSAFTTYSIEDDVDIKDCWVFDLGDVTMHVTDIPLSQRRIEETITEILKEHQNFIPILLGGDHSVSAPSIKAFKKNKGTVGVIQFDAHHDLRNLQDGGTTNGTPFRTLLEDKVIEGKHLVQIGIRDFSNSKEYFMYGKENGVKIYTMKDVREKPIKSLLADAIQYLKPLVDVIYVSVDMDVVDQAHAPGCPAIGPGGMDSQSLLEGIAYLGEESYVKGIDIVEIDPTLDVRDMTSRLGAHVILQFLKGKRKSLDY